MFENKIRDLINKKPIPTSAPVPGQLAPQIDELKYISHLLERLCWLTAPGNMEFERYQEILKENYNAGNIQGPAEVLRHL